MKLSVTWRNRLATTSAKNTGFRILFGMVVVLKVWNQEEEYIYGSVMTICVCPSWSSFFFPQLFSTIFPAIRRVSGTGSQHCHLSHWRCSVHSWEFNAINGAGGKSPSNTTILHIIAWVFGFSKQKRKYHSESSLDLMVMKSRYYYIWKVHVLKIILCLTSVTQSAGLVTNHKFFF